MDEVARMIDHSILLMATTGVDLVQGVEICNRHGVGCLVSNAFGCGQRHVHLAIAQLHVVAPQARALRACRSPIGATRR